MNGSRAWRRQFDDWVIRRSVRWTDTFRRLEHSAHFGGGRVGGEGSSGWKKTSVLWRCSKSPGLTSHSQAARHQAKNGRSTSASAGSTPKHRKCRPSSAPDNSALTSLHHLTQEFSREKSLSGPPRSRGSIETLQGTQRTCWLKCYC